MEKNTLRYSGIVFLAGASYGAQATTVKITYAAGFTWTQVVASQALFAALLFAVALLVQRARGKRLVPLSLKQTIALLALGLNTCIGTVLYNYALTLLPVSVAITLLFQFTWMGIVVQLVVMRRRPRAAEAAAAAVILGGTLMASGMFSESVGALDPVGIACGLLSAVSCTFFMFFSSRVGRGMPSVQRGLVVCLGACALGFAAPRLLRKRRSAGRHLEVRPRSGTMRAVRAGSAVRHRHAAPDTGAGCHHGILRASLRHRPVDARAGRAG